MADLSVTIGLDQTELEKGLAGAGKSIGKMNAGGKDMNPFQRAADTLSTGAGIGGLIAGPIGAAIGGFFDAFLGMINSVLSKIKEIAEYAQSIRLASLTTGLSIDQVREMEALGQAFGVSLQTMTRSFVEFTRRMGEVRIKGGEATNILAKMGVGLDELAGGTFNANRAMKALADSYAAGTDEATLLYYGTKLFGDSFKELLPIIKAGSKAIDDASGTYLEGVSDSTAAAGRLSNDISNIFRSVQNGLINLFGSFVLMIERIQYRVNNLFSPGAYNPFETLKNEVARKLANTPKYMTNEERAKMVLADIDFKGSKRREEAAKEEIKKQLQGDGNILSPFGLSPAGAASQMQQMGGGDIFGAVSFTPMERIATATEETARNTRPELTPTRTTDELTR